MQLMTYIDVVIQDVRLDVLEAMPPNARLTSNVWPRFERKPSKSTSTIVVVWKYCRKTLKGLATSRASHLRKHL